VSGQRDRASWDRLDAALVTLRTCATVEDLVDRACELAVQGCGAEAAALARVTDGRAVPWLQAGRPDLLDSLPVEPPLPAEVQPQLRGGHRVVVAPVVVHEAVAGLLYVAGADGLSADGLSDDVADIVDSYARALGSMFALLGVRRRVEEQRYALARLRHGLSDGGERPVELVDATSDLRTARPRAPSARVSSSALRARLTARQREVLDLMLSGLSNAEMAERLVVSVPTIKSHVRAVLRVSGAVNRAEAVARFSRGDAAQGPTRNASAARS
jgi:DNA-binding CsgD family transcriptional regulator